MLLCVVDCCVLMCACWRQVCVVCGLLVGVRCVLSGVYLLLCNVCWLLFDVQYSLVIACCLVSVVVCCGLCSCALPFVCCWKLVG